MATNSGKSNRVEVPEAKAALERFKTEVASELGVNLKEGADSAHDQGLTDYQG